MTRIPKRLDELTALFTAAIADIGLWSSFNSEPVLRNHRLHACVVRNLPIRRFASKTVLHDCMCGAAFSKTTAVSSNPKSDRISAASVPRCKD
jgi:hypothetical protein